MSVIELIGLDLGAELDQADRVTVREAVTEDG